MQPTRGTRARPDQVGRGQVGDRTELVQIAARAELGTIGVEEHLPNAQILNGQVHGGSQRIPHLSTVGVAPGGMVEGDPQKAALPVHQHRFLGHWHGTHRPALPPSPEPRTPQQRRVSERLRLQGLPDRQLHPQQLTEHQSRLRLRFDPIAQQLRLGVRLFDHDAVALPIARTYDGEVQLRRQRVPGAHTTTDQQPFPFPGPAPGLPHLSLRRRTVQVHDEKGPMRVPVPAQKAHVSGARRKVGYRNHGVHCGRRQAPGLASGHDRPV
ncbi:hypothetical protein IQ63_11170 [Streptomyces acidiscabies]|uniref:Uncharacterized protein n=1 Tax=Streptomyces acidiscabies TaxID=42234 RepID=A0A0L0KGL6_9ACTN|nr:hypothetical protein IQ63_11170 [Streptomyces acidiscabies]